VLGAAFLFGLSHILPTLNSLETDPAGEVLDSSAEMAAVAVGAVITTAIADVAFALLRSRVSSVAAPIVFAVGKSRRGPGVPPVPGRIASNVSKSASGFLGARCSSQHR
jgi:hypothetical protein